MDTEKLIDALVQSGNEAADDVLLEALRRGDAAEKPRFLESLVKRGTVHGLRGVVGQYDALPPALQKGILDNIHSLHAALRECGRSDEPALRLAAMKIIALGRQGKLAYILSDNLRSENPDISKAAVDSLVVLARWVVMQTKWLQRSSFDASGPLPDEILSAYNQMLGQRPEIESAVVRAMDVSRGRYGPELLRAALLLCDWPGSKTLAILQTAKHGGQTAMVRRLEQPPTAEHVEAFLLSASHAQLRQQFAAVFAHISDTAVLDSLLRRTHWLKDAQLQLCMHQVTRGAWWGESELLEEAARRDSDQAARIGDWLIFSGAHDVIQDDRMERLKVRADGNFSARVHLLRLAAQRRRGGSVQLLKGYLTDPDERLVRMAAREILRRRPPEYEGMLLTLMANAAPTVRRVISRSLGHIGFEQYWERFDKLDLTTRRQAGRAMLKILPDSGSRLRRRMNNGSIEQRLKAMQMAQDLGLIDVMREPLTRLSEHTNPKVRSRAVAVIANAPDVANDAFLSRVLNDADARVRANAIEVIDAAGKTQFLPVLADRAKSGQSRERANSIKALHHMKAPPAGDALLAMLNDTRADHRVSAIWALREIGFWKLLGEVGRLAKQDSNMRVRRFALAVLKEISDKLTREKGKTG